LGNWVSEWVIKDCWAKECSSFRPRRKKLHPPLQCAYSPLYLLLTTKLSQAVTKSTCFPMVLVEIKKRKHVIKHIKHAQQYPSWAAATKYLYFPAAVGIVYEQTYKIYKRSPVALLRRPSAFIHMLGRINDAVNFRLNRKCICL
jgi:hypothetical protein